MFWCAIGGASPCRFCLLESVEQLIHNNSVAIIKWYILYINEQIVNSTGI